jgi:nitrogen-specific signal transduction histidine kinase
MIYAPYSLPKKQPSTLGLAISKLLIEAHGGRLLYATGSQSQNVYTEFIIFLPPAEKTPRTGVEIV